MQKTKSKRLDCGVRVDSRRMENVYKCESVMLML